MPGAKTAHDAHGRFARGSGTGGSTKSAAEALKAARLQKRQAKAAVEAAILHVAGLQHQGHADDSPRVKAAAGAAVEMIREHIRAKDAEAKAKKALEAAQLKPHFEAALAKRTAARDAERASHQPAPAPAHAPSNTPPPVPAAGPKPMRTGTWNAATGQITFDKPPGARTSKSEARQALKGARADKLSAKRDVMAALKAHAESRRALGDAHPTTQAHKGMALDAYRKHTEAAAREKDARQALGQRGASTMGKLTPKGASQVRALSRVPKPRAGRAMPAGKAGGRRGVGQRTSLWAGGGLPARSGGGSAVPARPRSSTIGRFLRAARRRVVGFSEVA